MKALTKLGGLSNIQSKRLIKILTLPNRLRGRNSLLRFFVWCGRVVKNGFEAIKGLKF
ncbi:hypothetical protein FC07_GL001378 [Loigolactobacillus bifermentans DSM 20003]|jgi:hypothetical protein|uniref:Uncharacterized protein n=1 Tax=Loigolactobacillus bifermentans DSM 20003 TaxID=1423726 RepID=A0A0R1H119_9LACO|nr:hypothetical protein FC07_GL001378 [Loigolactobacillus bifermentans DSM 20003]